jgi:hypothetical protein
MSEKEKAIECIKALSRIEGATMSLGGLTNREVFTQNIDVIMKYFEELLGLNNPRKEFTAYNESEIL